MYYRNKHNQQINAKIYATSVNTDPLTEPKYAEPNMQLLEILLK